MGDGVSRDSGLERVICESCWYIVLVSPTGARFDRLWDGAVGPEHNAARCTELRRGEELVMVKRSTIRKILESYSIRAILMTEARAELKTALEEHDTQHRQ